MKIIAEIREQDINPGAPKTDPSDFEHREAVRVVVVNEAGQVALLNVVNRRFHKLPGGGVEPGENRLEALKREVLEEIGCRIEATVELGQVIEYRDEWRQVQTSYCYLARQVGEQQQNSLTKDEEAWGFEPIWADSIDDAIAILDADHPGGYDGRRMKPRDLAILRVARDSLVKKTSTYPAEI